VKNDYHISVDMLFWEWVLCKKSDTVNNIAQIDAEMETWLKGSYIRASTYVTAQCKNKYVLHYEYLLFEDKADACIFKLFWE
jgi:hypothetical protein